MRKTAKAIWEADGRWTAVVAFRKGRVVELMQKDGLSPTHAGRAAFDEALEKFPLGDAPTAPPVPEVRASRPKEPGGRVGDAKDAPEVVPEKARPSREPTKSEIVDWIFYHIGDQGLTEKTSLCSAAWFWLCEARKNPIMKGELFAKAMPSRQQIEAIERRTDSKEPTCDLLRRFFEHVPVLSSRPEGGDGKPPVQAVGTTGNLG